MNVRWQVLVPLCAAICVASALAVTAQVDRGLPADVESVGVEQKLDAELPLDLIFTDENGRVVRLGDYFEDGRPVLLSFVYYDCPMLCGLVLDGLVEALGEMDWTPGQQFRMLTVSIDPEDRPTAARLKKQNVLAAYGRPQAAEGWSFLTGDRSSIRRLTDTVGFDYEYLPGRGEFAHSAALFVLTPEGRVSRYLFGVRYEPRTLRLSLVEAAEGQIGSIVDRFLLTCYRYDEQAGHYAPVARKLMRMGGGLTVTVLGVVLLGFWRRERRRVTS